MTRSVTLLVGLLFSLGRAAAGDTIWTRRYDGFSLGDYPVALTVDRNGDVFVTGRSANVTGATMDDYVTVKYRPNGSIAWIARYDGNCPVLNYRDDRATGIALDSAGNVYVTGSSFSNLNGRTTADYLTIRYNPETGDTIWTRRFTGPGNKGNDVPNAIVVKGNAVYVTGQAYGDSTTRADYATLKYDTNGNLLWDRWYDSGIPYWSNTDIATALAVDDSGNVYVTGYSFQRTSDCDYLTIRYDADGYQRWIRAYEGALGGDDCPATIIFDRFSRKVYVTGRSVGTVGQDYLTVCYEPQTGIPVWIQRYDGGSDDQAYAMTADGSGGIYVTGKSNNDCLTIKYNVQGDSLWAMRYDGPNHYGDWGKAIVVTRDGGVAVAGTSMSSANIGDYLAIKYAADGSQQWLARYNSSANLDDQATAIAADNSGYVYVTGSSRAIATMEDYLTIKYSDIPAHDVGVLRIAAPTGMADSGTVVIPRVWFRNFGQYQDTFAALLRIGTDYADSIVLFLAPGDSALRGFSALTLNQRGKHIVSCTVRLAGDINPGNNRQLDSVVVRVRDVEVLSITAPSGIIDSGVVIVPQARLRNNGTEYATFTSELSIGPWRDTQSITLPPGAVRLINFRPWIAGPRGCWAVKCTARLNDDMVAANNVQRESIRVAVTDVGVLRLTAPRGSYESSASIVPQVIISNCGTKATPAKVTLMITRRDSTVYRDSVTMPTLAAGDSAQIDFAVWLPPHPTGDYLVHCAARAAGDRNAMNDTLSGGFTIRAAGQRTGWQQCADIPAGQRGRRVKDGGCLAALNEFSVYCLKGNNTCELYVYNTVTNTWVTCESIPAIGRSGRKKTVRKGGALTAIADMLYAVKGNSSFEFWRYQPSGEVYPWTQLADVPAGARPVRDGAGLTALRMGETTFVCLLKGSGTTEFYRYNILSDCWETLSSAPLGAAGKPFKSGSAVASTPDGRIYALKGSCNEFFLYDADQDSWQATVPLPFIGNSGRKKRAKEGAALAYLENRCYALKGGNTREFWCYHPLTGDWAQYDDMPAGGGKPVKAGGALTSGDGKLWALKGNNTLEFYCYVPLPVAAGRQTGDFHGVCQVMVTDQEAPDAHSVRQSSGRKPGLSIYSVAGRKIAQLSLPYTLAGDYRVSISGMRLSAGIYLVELVTDSAVIRHKLVISR